MAKIMAMIYFHLQGRLIWHGDYAIIALEAFYIVLPLLCDSLINARVVCGSLSLPLHPLSFPQAKLVLEKGRKKSGQGRRLPSPPASPTYTNAQYVWLYKILIP